MKDEIRGRRILVTGAFGFIGANLAKELLNQGCEVHALVRPKTDRWRVREVIPHLAIHPVDLTDQEGLRKSVDFIRPEIIFHLAVGRPSASNQDHREMLRVNVLGTFNLLEAVAPFDYHCFVHVGSSMEYGSRNEPMEESSHPEPLTFFGATKAAATLICQQFARGDNRPVVILRPFYVYGYWDSPTHLIPTAVMAALNHRELLLTVPGYRRDYVFIEDLVEACLLVLWARDIGGEVVNIASGQQTANEEVVDLIQELTGQRIEVRVGAYGARCHDRPFWCADIRKAKRLLNWGPRHTLKAGFEKTIAWHRLHKEEYDRVMPDTGY
mgnify:CR=1 FL=1